MSIRPRARFALQAFDEVRFVDVQRKAVIKNAGNERKNAETRFVVQRMETRSLVAAAAFNPMLFACLLEE